MGGNVLVVRKARPGARLPVGDVQVTEGLVLSFTPGKLFGAVAVGAVLVGDHPRFAEGLARIKKIPDYILPPDGAFEFASATPEPARAPVKAPEWDRNGWLDDDFSASPLDRSPTTGLTNIEMTACSAPAGWAELRATHFPWQLPGWHAPTSEWVAPVGASKVKASNPDAPPVILTLPDAPAPEVVETVVTDGEPSPLVDEGEGVAPTTDYPEESIAAALEILQPLASARKTALPLGQANLALKKAGLPPVSNTKNLAGLLAR